ncbi:hypothetical protein BD410DRAFT_82215 [Rickenella mellea]|uniref:F-box domain-containing protein n=1 Tax=Rickenella mellea TaxID=50990 RepID=A0A4Y7PLN9_9AGAM|nr:hypothetical protein BD410DRAFT_82215 [Rickenella mellea]
MDPHFPPEIWRNIFRFATFTEIPLQKLDWGPHSSSPKDAHRDLDPTLAYHSVQSALPTKKALTLVSRSFREMSLEHMFELVELFRTRNAQLLLDTIPPNTAVTDKGNSPTKWIKCIIVSLDYYQSTNELYLMDELLTKLLPFCTNLDAFGWKTLERVDSAEKIDRSITTLMESLPPTITTLEWLRYSPVQAFHSLRNHTTLRNLRIADISYMSPGESDVIIPSITHLDARTRFTTIAASRWGLPSVSHVTLDWIESPVLALFGNCRDTIRSIYFPDPWRCRSISDDFSRILTSLPKLETFSYGITVNLFDPPRLASPWLGVARHPSLTHIYLFCRDGLNPEMRSFSTIRGFFSFQLQPLVNSHMMPLTITIVDTGLIFERGDYREDGYDDGAKQRFFDDLSASLSSANIQCIVK